jgi:chromosome partitioning protein
MKTIVCANQKGGVGKTTINAHLAFFAAEIGERVLAIDLDSQRTLSKDLFAGLDDESGAGSMASALFGKRAVEPKRVLSPPKCKGLIDLVAGDDGLQRIDETSSVSALALRERLSKITGYDVCIIDPPPTLGKRLEAALIAADCVVMPFVPTRQGVDGLGQLMDTVERVRSTSNPNLVVIGLLANLVNKRSANQLQTLEELGQSVGELLLPISIASRTSIADALGESVPVWGRQGGGSQREAALEMREAIDTILGKCFA